MIDGYSFAKSENTKCDDLMFSIEHDVVGEITKIVEWTHPFKQFTIQTPGFKFMAQVVNFSLRHLPMSRKSYPFGSDHGDRGVVIRQIFATTREIDRSDRKSMSMSNSNREFLIPSLLKT